MESLPPMTREAFDARMEEVRAHLAANPPREVILARMGYRDYFTEYLDSPLWRKIRSRVLRRAQQLCVRCGDRATEVHHLSYSEAVLKGDDDSQLAAICRSCHEAVERDGDGKRRTEAEKSKAFFDSTARHAREERERRWTEDISRDSDYAESQGYRCGWCGGDARSPGSIKGSCD